MHKGPKDLSRRGFLATSAAMIGTGAAAQTANSTEIEGEIAGRVQRNLASFRSLDWQPYFNTLQGGAILVDLQSRALHFWSADQSIYKLYPTSVPLTEDLTRKGRTEVIRKVEGPEWRPTPSRHFCVKRTTSTRVGMQSTSFLIKRA